ncbi:hypothetical protein EJ110_NYTH23279 [Nymphaea thermarum]|nr:hypothetical protein EJ110_NYTH23279 [Nymphaea thermarum]
MAWLAKSLANSFNSDEKDDGDSGDTNGRGVKEDLSELTKSFTRQLWGVASFLAPPPPDHTSSSSPPAAAAAAGGESSVPSDSDSGSLVKESADNAEIAGESPRMSGIRSDLSEIGGRFRTEISRLASGNKAVSEISRFASSFLPFGSGDEEGYSEGIRDEAIAGAVGVTEEVLTFARNISMHPETWLDFPLFTDDEDDDDFEMSDAQQDHALAVERLAPRLAALRIELCPGHMSEGCFWKIYFVLLHSRLSKHDAELLSTPQIVQARSMLQELQNHAKTSTGRIESSTYAEETGSRLLPQEGTSASDIESSYRGAALEPSKSIDVEIESEKLSTNNDSRFVDKSVIDEKSFIQNEDVLTRIVQVSSDAFEEEDGDDWLEESAEISGSGHVTTALVDEDVSFSDLEEDDDNCVPTRSNAKDASASSGDGSRGRVQLNDVAVEDHRFTASSHMLDNKSLSAKDTKDGDPGKPTEGGESSDWLSLDEIDVA